MKLDDRKFMILSAILNKSNNMGDSRAEIRDFSSEIVYLSQENNMKHNIQLFVSYTDMNYETLTKSRDYLDRAAKRKTRFRVVKNVKKNVVVARMSQAIDRS